MNCQPLMSIIIPVYNIDEYILRCIESLLIQNVDFSLLEIIVVNDGSSDRSYDIVYENYNHLSFLKLFSKPNGGLSSARNFGLEQASGEYIWFVDGDDWIFEGCLHLIMNKIRVQPDVLALNYAFFYESTGLTPLVRKGIVSDKAYSGAEFLLLPFQEFGVPFYIIKRSILIENSLTFCEGILHEDMLFTPQMLLFSKRIYFFPELSYIYFQRVGSIMNSRMYDKKCKDLLFVLQELMKFGSQFSANKEYVGAIANAISIAARGFFINWLRLSSSEKNLYAGLFDYISIFPHIFRSHYKRYLVYAVYQWIYLKFICIYSLKKKFRASSFLG